MNPEIKKQWVDALRSGEYMQTQGTLKNHKGYCCLGVLTDLYLKEHNEKWEQCGTHYSYEGDDCNLSPIIQVWSGLNTWIESDLITMNDEEEKTFQEIAEYIKENL